MLSSNRLKIGFRVGEFPKLSETFVLDQINFMIDQGHDVRVLAQRREDVVLDSTLDAYAAALERTTFIEPQRGLPALAYNRLPYRLRVAHAARSDAKLCSGTDVVICNFGWFGSDVVRHRTSKENDAKVITIFHGADLSRDVRDERENVYDQLLREGDLHLPINSNWFEWLEAHGAPPEKLALHHLGVDPDDFPYSARRDTPDTQPFVFTNVCRMVEKKGLAFALKGLAELRRLEPNRKFHFRMAGDGPLLEELQQLTRTLDLSDVVTFLGRIPHSAINQELSDADAFLAPSVVAKDGDMEGIPIAIMEAMAVGLPVVSTFHSGIPELITHNVNGRLCREHDVNGLAELMREVMTEPELTRQYALEARRTIESKFNSRVSNARLESFVQAIAHGEAILPQNPSMRQAG